MLHRIFAAFILISPLIILTNLAYPYALPRWIFISLVCWAWSLALAIDILRKKITFKFSPIDYAFIAFVSALGLSTLTSIDRTHSLWGSMERSFAFSLWPLLLIAFFGLKLVLSNAASKIFLLRVFVVSVFLASLWGILQKLLPGFSQTFSGARIGGTLGNAIFFGSYLTLSIGILSYYLTLEKYRSRWWYAAIITIITATTTLLFTQTRGPLLGLCAGAFVATSVYVYFKSSKKIIVLVSIAALLIAGLMGSYVAYQKNLISPTTITTRLFNWNMAWDGFKEKPLLGWGPENYSRATDAHFIPELSEYSIAETHTDKPHNYFLELAVTSGFLGLAAYVILLCITLQQIYSQFKKSNISRAQAALFSGTLAASIIQNMSSFETHGSVLVFILLLALISAQEKTIKNPLVTTITFTALPIIATLIVLFGVIPTLRDSSAYIQTLELNQSYTNEHAALLPLKQYLSATPFPRDYFTAISFAIVGQYWQNAPAREQLTSDEKKLHEQDMQWLRETISDLSAQHPSDGVWKLPLAHSAFQLFSITRQETDGDVAEKLYTDYSLVAPRRQEPLMQLAQLALLTNKPDNAVDYLHAAIKLDPNYLTPYWQRSLALFALKKTDLAWTDIEFLMSQHFMFTPPHIANYVYNQLLNNQKTSEAESFRAYFEGSF